LGWCQADGKGVDAGATKPEDAVDAARYLQTNSASLFSDAFN
jgi:hypothetical protein